MDLATLHTYIWTYLDVDQTDLPPVLLDQWVQSCATDIARFERRWPWLAKTFPFTSIGTQKTYAYSDIDQTLDIIEQIDGPNWTLDYINHSDANRWFGNYQLAAQGAPGHWSTQNSTLWLWPTPDSPVAYTIGGFRLPVPITVGGPTSQTIDLPDDFTGPLFDYVLSEAYLQQDDPQSAQPHAQKYMADLVLLHKRLTAAPMPRPLVAGGGVRNMNTPFGPQLPPYFPRQ